MSYYDYYCMSYIILVITGLIYKQKVTELEFDFFILLLYVQLICHTSFINKGFPE